MADPITIARWVGEAGWPADTRVKATAIALASGADPTAPGGLFGVGNTGDGPAQAKHALDVYRAQGWSAFPRHRSGLDVLMMPPAVAAVAAAGAVAVVSDVPKGAEKAATPITAPAQLATTAGAIATYATTEEFWRRAVKFGMGVTMMMIGAFKLTRGLVFKPVADVVVGAGRTVAAAAPVAAPAARALSNVGRPRPVRSPADTEVVTVHK